jgi:hypothetical protein
LALLCLSALAAGSFVVLVVLQSRLTFVADDWRFLLQRRGFSPDTFLGVHNDHIVVAPVSIYKLLLVTFGMRSALPFQVVATLVFVASAVLLFDWPALLASAMILFLGAAWNDLLWSFQIGFSGSMAAGIGALLAVQRGDRRGDLIAAALLVVATSFSELGVSFDLGVLIGIGVAQGRPSRRLYVALVPLALYGLWYLGWGQQGIHAASLHNLIRSPKFAFDLLSQNLASLLGLATPLSGSGSQLVGLNWGRAVLVVSLALVVWLRRGTDWRSPALWTVLIAGGSFWFLTGLNAYHGYRQPTSGRYQYPGAVFVLLIAAELLRRAQLSKRVLSVATAVSVLAMASGLIFLRDGYHLIKGETDLERARLAAVELAKGHESPDYRVILDIFTQIPVRTYLAAVRSYGSPAFTEAQLASAGERDREDADATLAAAERLALTPLTGGRVPAVGCARSLAGRGEVALQPGTYALRNVTGDHLAVALRRFADAPSVSLVPVAPRAPMSLTIVADRAHRPWRIAVTGQGAVSICASSRGLAAA